MSTKNDVVIAVASKYAGVSEQPKGGNRGPSIDRWQQHWGMGAGTAIGPQPWCGMFISGVLREASLLLKSQGGVTDIGHPSTWAMGQRKQYIIPWQKAVPGAVVVWPEGGGTHTEMLIEQTGMNGVWRCLGGNVNDAVRWTTRDIRSGCTILCSPELKDYKPVVRTDYWLEDTTANPVQRGPWLTQRGRDKVLATLPLDRQRKARKVRIGKKYAFIEGSRRFYGPYPDRAARDRSQEVIESRLGRRLRRFSKKVQPALSSLVPESLGKTT